MKYLLALVFIGLGLLSYGQGLLLSPGQSGGELSFTTYKSKHRYSKTSVHSLGYGYSIKRNVDISLAVNIVDKELEFGSALSGYINTKSPLAFRATLSYTGMLGYGVTVMYSKPTDGFKLVPNVGYFKVDRLSTYLVGLDAKLGKGNFGVIAGLHWAFPSYGDEYFLFTVGILFVES